MDIVLISRYGSKNIGDELIVQELEKTVCNKEDRIYRFNFNLEYFSSFELAFSHKSNPMKNKDESKVFQLYKKYFRKLFLVSIIRSIRNKIRAKRNKNMGEYRRILQRCDILIIGGGNAIYDLEKYSDSAFYFKLILNEAQKLKKPIFVTSIGIGPFTNRKQIKNTVEALKLADYITVRDKRSFEYISCLNDSSRKVYQTIDPVIVMGERGKSFSTMKTIGISVMDIRLSEYGELQYQKYLNNLYKIIHNYIDKTNMNITIFATELADLVALKDIKKIIVENNILEGNRIRFIEEVDRESIIDLYGEIQYLLGTRMHSLILAFSQGIPFVGVAWQQKVNEFSKMVCCEDKIISLNDFIANYVKSLDLMDQIIKQENNLIIYFKNKKESLVHLNNINNEIIDSIRSSIG